VPHPQGGDADMPTRPRRRYDEGEEDGKRRGPARRPSRGERRRAGPVRRDV